MLLVCTLSAAWASNHELTFSGARWVKDTELTDGNNGPDGSTDSVTARAPGSDAEKKILIQVPDLVGGTTDQVPAGATVSTAHLSGSPIDKDASGADKLGGWAVAEAWDEDHASWGNANSGDPWSGEGVTGTSLGDECGPAQSVDGLQINLVPCSDAVFDGSANHGWVLTMDGSGSEYFTFASTESGQDGALEVYVAFDAEDADGDGWWAGTAVGYDCNDDDVDVNPGAEERSGNGEDDDCDGTIDEATGDDTGDEPVDTALEPDADGDRMPGGSGLDCDDTNPDVYAGHAEWCDGYDNDCNGKVDDECQDPVTTELGEGCSCSTTPGVLPAGFLLVSLAMGRVRRRRA